MREAIANILGFGLAVIVSAEVPSRHDEGE
jgi:hypothetical protein